MTVLYHEHNDDAEMHPQPISPEQREEVIAHMAAWLAQAYRYFRAQRKAGTNSPRFALLLVDVINDLDFLQNEELLRNLSQLAKRIAKLKQSCQKAGIPIIYINDNHGKWRSQFQDVLKQCLRHDPGRQMVKELFRSRKITSC